MKNLLFVDDEPRILQGLQRQLHSLHGEWDMNFVGGGRQAPDFMVEHPVDGGSLAQIKWRIEMP
jgi:YesN/AraC family two-component response regulator